MNRDELLDLLSRLVDEGFLDVAQARDILRAFERGELSAAALNQAAPLDPMFRFAAVGTELGSQARRRTRTVAGVPLERVIVGQRQTVIIRMVEVFDDEAFRLARRFSRGQVPLADWQAEMRDLVAREMMSNAQLGVGRDLLPSEMVRLREAIDVQADYLQRFADDIAARRLRAETIGDVEPYSERYIRARSQQYSGAARAEYYRGAEADLPAGFVMRYIALDDSGTCSPCSDAAQNSPFLPGQGPIPGQICLGRGLCRCRREQVWDPVAYAELADEPVGAEA